MSSQDFGQAGFNPSIGIKGFIATMMSNSKKTVGELGSSSSRGALRTKNNHQLTHFGSEDAVSEKSEKDEESLSEDGSGSEAQDLSEEDQDNILNQVLDELMPNRVKKTVDPVTAHITITKLKPDPVPLKPLRKNLKSANRIVMIDKKMIQKEQLLMPTAAPDLQVTQGGQVNFHVTNPPYDIKR